MTPFQVYLLMQADSICSITGWLAIFSGIAFVISTIARYGSKSAVTTEDIVKQTQDWRDWQFAVSCHKWAIAIFFPCLFISTFMPNTKTIATMVVLPKITSPAALNAMGEKGQQLYDIATQALQGLVDKNKPYEQTEEKKAP